MHRTRHRNGKVKVVYITHLLGTYSLRKVDLLKGVMDNDILHLVQVDQSSLLCNKEKEDKIKNSSTRIYICTLLSDSERP